MLSGRGLFLLFFATLLTISNERPTGKERRQREIVESQEATTGKGEDEKKEEDVVESRETAPNDEEEEAGNDEAVPIPEKKKEKNSLDYNDNDGVSLKKAKEIEDFVLVRNSIENHELAFDQRIENRKNPRKVSKLSGKKFKCHIHAISIEYACHMEYNLDDYSDYDHFIRHFNTTIPKVTPSRSRKVDPKEPCVALHKPQNGKLKISCGCNDKEKVPCKSIADLPAKYARILRFSQGGKVKVERNTVEKARRFFDKYKYYLLSAIIGLIVLIALVVISIVEWKGMQRNEKKRKERIHKLSERVENSRNSLRTTCSDPSEPKEDEFSAFKELIKKR